MNDVQRQQAVARLEDLRSEVITAPGWAVLRALERLGVHHEPDVQDLGSRPEIKTEEGGKAILRRFHLILAIVGGVPISDFELDELDDDEADALLAKVVEIIERRERDSNPRVAQAAASA